MPQLRSLFVDRCKRITDAGLAPLVRRSADLVGQAGNHESRHTSHRTCCAQGTHCPNLRRVHVGGTMITYYALAALNSLEDLQDVSGTQTFLIIIIILILICSFD
jgi:hypothetical protein